MKSFKQRALTLVLYLMTLPIGNAVAEGIDQSVRLWAQVETLRNFYEDQQFLYYLEQNFRLFNPDNVYDQMISRMGLGYQLTRNVTVWQGYDFGLFKSICTNRCE